MRLLRVNHNDKIITCIKHVFPALFMMDIVGGKSINAVDNVELIEVNNAIRNHPIEATGQVLRKAMTAMKRVKRGSQKETALA